MWETKISAGCVAMFALLFVGAAMVVLGDAVGDDAVSLLGVLVGGGGLAMMVMRDNQRTRRMLARPGEHVGPMRSVPATTRDWT